MLCYAQFCKQSFRSTKLLFPKFSQALHLHFLLNFNKAKKRYLLRYARFCKQSFRLTKLLFPKSSQALFSHFLLNFRDLVVKR